MDDKTTRCKALTIDAETATVKIGPHEVILSRLEYSVLVYLAQRAGKFVSGEELLVNVWGHSDGGTSDQVRSLIKRLRHKLNEHTEEPASFVRSRTGWGYQFCPENSEDLDDDFEDDLD